MILLVTNRADITSDHVVLEIQRRAVPYARLNTEDLAQASIGWRSDGPRTGWTLALRDRAIDLNLVRAAYLRRPRLPDLSTIARPGERAYSAGEWAALLEAIYAELDDRWLNRPAAIARAENKPGQIALAARLGFRTPPTLVTNDPVACADFAATAAVIVKPLRNGAIEEASDPRIVFTTRIEEPVRPGDAEAIRIAPFIAQHEIRKTCDVRVTVVGEQAFAARIDSQGVPETATDWRRGDVSELRHSIHRLPEETVARTVRLVRAMGLRFGAVDLVLDHHGEYWFLEINPNGQWAWVEALTGLSIASAIVDELQRISSAWPAF